MDLALNILQRLICHKTQPTNQKNKSEKKKKKKKKIILILVQSLIEMANLILFRVIPHPSFFLMLNMFQP